MGRNRVDAVREHARNLLSPATPYFFNTVYDPYRGGSDFVRGFPYRSPPSPLSLTMHVNKM